MTQQPSGDAVTWFVVADGEEPDDKIWTLSRDPKVSGWNTDSGYPGYGLVKADAEELANAANRPPVSLADIILLSVLERENDIVKIAEAVMTWRRAREALDYPTTQAEKST